jgi:hypothetical protein
LVGREEGNQIINAGYAACWQTIPLLLVMRAYVCRLSKHRNFVVLPMVAVLFVLGYHYIPGYLVG